MSAAAAKGVLPNADFEYVRELVRRGSAIVLEAGKEYLVEARLGPLARREGVASWRALVAKLRAEREGPLHRKVIEAMTTNETSFFRDVHPFEALRAVLTERTQGGGAIQPLRVWSAACSTGQEPYTIAILLREHFPALVGPQTRILATDLSQEVLARAKDGVFGQIEINRGLPARLMVKYFTQDGLEWRLSDDVKRMVEFRELNLATTWPMLGTFDVVFLRNVLIYFDLETKRSILGRVRRVLAPGGHLFLGAAETTLNLDDGFERVQVGKSVCYRVKAAR